MVPAGEQTQPLRSRRDHSAGAGARGKKELCLERPHRQRIGKLAGRARTYSDIYKYLPRTSPYRRPATKSIHFLLLNKEFLFNEWMGLEAGDISRNFSYLTKPGMLKMEVKFLCNK